MTRPSIFVAAPDFRITASAFDDWAMSLDVSLPALKEVVRLAFLGETMVVSGPTLLRPDAPIWKVVLDVPGCRAELKVRVDSHGRWKTVLSAWGVPV